MSDRISPVDFHLWTLQDMLTKIGYGEIVDYTHKGIHLYGFDKEKVKQYIGPMGKNWETCFEALWKTIMMLPNYRKEDLII